MKRLLPWTSQSHPHQSSTSPQAPQQKLSCRWGRDFHLFLVNGCSHNTTCKVGRSLQKGQKPSKTGIAGAVVMISEVAESIGRPCRRTSSACWTLPCPARPGSLVRLRLRHLQRREKPPSARPRQSQALQSLRNCMLSQHRCQPSQRRSQTGHPPPERVNSPCPSSSQPETQAAAAAPNAMNLQAHGTTYGGT